MQFFFYLYDNLALNVKLFKLVKISIDEWYCLLNFIIIEIKVDNYKFYVYLQYFTSNDTMCICCQQIFEYVNK